MFLKLRLFTVDKNKLEWYSTDLLVRDMEYLTHIQGSKKKGRKSDESASYKNLLGLIIGTQSLMKNYIFQVICDLQRMCLFMIYHDAKSLLQNSISVFFEKKTKEHSTYIYQKQVDFHVIIHRTRNWCLLNNCLQWKAPKSLLFFMVLPALVKQWLCW